MITKFNLLDMKPKHKIKDFVTFIGKNKQFYFHIRGHNNRVILPSEGYKTKASRTKTISAINSSLASAVPVVEKAVKKAKG